MLGLSKLQMYNFHYNDMKVNYPHADQLRLLFTTTDSLEYAVQTENIYRGMADDAATKYDFSEYPLDHPLYNTSNRKALGFFKDELNSVPMEEFVGLRPKCYAFLHTGKVDRNVLQHDRTVEKKTAKGIKRKVKDDRVRTVHQQKVGLTAFDTKRWLREDTINTQSHGHKDTAEDPMALVN